ncbi:MAG: hypothetical protein A2284_03945 [Deltaproteobacteria bacterium RIFOXYA12_FULL_61_11]|nr:MAG: hypothetical protein A2284_03945 [Deltaproteobacteria bacterium RIFOXYA12_FULL_61_11]
MFFLCSLLLNLNNYYQSLFYLLVPNLGISPCTISYVISIKTEKTKFSSSLGYPSCYIVIMLPNVLPSFPLSDHL